MHRVDGVLIIDKPAGLTSHDVVARVRKIIGHRRVGHTGTLDPFATGVLVILVGRATRLAQFLSGAEKEYEAVIRLGCATDTGDLTGARLQTDFTADIQGAPRLRRDQIEAALASLRGENEQTPPMYSAKKIAGEKLYELARRGAEVERQPIRIRVSEFELIGGDESIKQTDNGVCDLSVRVVCSAGTYVRVLAEDLGKRLGVGAHLAQLRRTRAGSFKIADAITLERLGELGISGSISRHLISPDDALSFLPSVDLNNKDVTRTLNGINLKIEDAVAANWRDAQPVRMRDTNGNLIAVGTYESIDRVLHPIVVISNNAS